MNTIKTKFGTAKLNRDGRYRITTGKEGNYGKLLHRLVFEDYHGCKLNENDVIHHIDNNPLNNHPTNLICMSRKAHGLLHKKWKKHSEESKQKMSENSAKYWKGKKRSYEHNRELSKSTNTSGYLNVYKRKHKEVKQGFVWCYRYHDENGKRKAIVSVDIKKLEKKVKAKGLPWEVLN